MFERFLRNKITALARRAVDSTLFPVFTGAFVFLFYVLRLQLVALAVLAGVTALVLVLFKNIRPAISPVALAHLVLSYQLDESGKALYASSAYVAVFAVFGSLLVGALVFNLIVYRKERRPGKSRLVIGISGMCLAFLLGGIFSDYYGIANFTTGLAFTASYLLVYIAFFFMLEHREDDIRYLAIVLAVAAAVIVCQVAHIYATRYTLGTPLDGKWKGDVVAGWGISNTLGEYLAMLFPAVFYLVYKEKRGYCYYVLIVAMAAAMYFTLSRAAILCGGVAFAAGAAVNCFIGQNKKINRIIGIALAGLLVLVLVIAITPGVMDKLFVFFTQTGADDRGRYAIWREWLRLFTEEPVLGVGFRAYRILHPGEFAINAHNTLVQMLAGTGIVGLLLYLYHRYETVRLFARRPNTDRIFIGGVILVALLESLLDPLFFRPYFAIYYSIILVVVEKSLTADEKKETETRTEAAE